jgi:hypothetical protein
MHSDTVIGAIVRDAGSVSGAFHWRASISTMPIPAEVSQGRSF